MDQLIGVFGIFILLAIAMAMSNKIYLLKIYLVFPMQEVISYLNHLVKILLKLH